MRLNRPNRPGSSLLGELGEEEGGRHFVQKEPVDTDAENIEKALQKAQESYRLQLKRKGRRASILTSPQGVVDPLGSQM